MAKMISRFTNLLGPVVTIYESGVDEESTFLKKLTFNVLVVSDVLCEQESLPNQLQLFLLI